MPNSLLDQHPLLSDGVVCNVLCEPHGANVIPFGLWEEGSSPNNSAPQRVAPTVVPSRAPCRFGAASAHLTYPPGSCHPREEVSGWEVVRGSRPNEVVSSKFLRVRPKVRFAFVYKFLLAAFSRFLAGPKSSRDNSPPGRGNLSIRLTSQSLNDRFR